MFSKHKGFTLVELLIVIIVIGILAGGMMLASGSATDSARASTLLSELRSAKAAGVMFLADHNDIPMATILSWWVTPIMAGAGTSFDQYMDNPLKVAQLRFYTDVMPTPAGNVVEVFFVGKEVPDTIVAEKIFGMAGSSLFNDTAAVFTPGTDNEAYMIVR